MCACCGILRCTVGIQPNVWASGPYSARKVRIGLPFGINKCGELEGRLKKKWVLSAIAGFLVLTMAGTLIGRWAGQDLADEVKERLTELWPDVMELPQKDRSLLALLAYECRLPNRPKGRGDTIACLRSATAAERMKKVSPDPAAHLEKLLDQAKQKASRTTTGAEP